MVPVDSLELFFCVCLPLDSPGALLQLPGLEMWVSSGPLTSFDPSGCYLDLCLGSPTQNCFRFRCCDDFRFVAVPVLSRMLRWVSSRTWDRFELELELEFELEPSARCASLQAVVAAAAVASAVVVSVGAIRQAGSKKFSVMWVKGISRNVFI